ncbi:MAG: M20/M25/M40 family metallo-hydrolase [Spirochaetales bacterium]|nr:M20/M25/M40 family metallo-hydrolase [Spirochaetales bacterium]
MLLSILFITLFIILLLVRTVLFSRNRQSLQGTPASCDSIDGKRAAESLSQAITYRTISYGDYDKFDYGEFGKFLNFLIERFPRMAQQCSPRRINDYSVLYHWKGTDGGLPPLLLLGHYDVVPVEEGTEGEWRQDPFSGVIEGGELWGRGSLDMKVQIISHLEAAEQLLAEGFQPQRDIWFSYNYDEEQRGSRGASQAVEFFKEKGIRFDSVFDEGGCIVKGAMPGVEPPLAIIGLAEKGCANFRIKVKGSGGHSSMPPRSTALGKLSRIITDLEQNPMKPRMTPPVRQMLRVTSPEMSFVSRLALANQFLFKPLLFKIFAANPTTNAMIRTSFSATMSRTGDAPNVLPLSAEAVINCRPLPGDSVSDALNHLHRMAVKSCDPNEYEIEIILGDNASPLSPYETSSYRKIESMIKKYYPQALVSPYLMMGGSDSSKFYPVCDNIYRFMPILINKEELDTMHNSNERISLDNITRSTAFFKEFIKEYDQ